MGYCHWRCRDGEIIRKAPQAGGADAGAEINHAIARARPCRCRQQQRIVAGAVT